MERKQVVVRKVPVDLWQQLKVQAAKEGRPLQELIESALKQYLEQAA